MCCLYGMIDYGAQLNMKKKNRMLNVLSKECEERGTHATGIAYNWGGQLRINKKALPAHVAKLIPMGSPTVIMGHTRFTTKGSEKDNYNNHPFMGHFDNSRFALAHNGVLYNDDLLRKSEKLPETKIKTDSYVAVQLIEKHNALNFDSLKDMAEKVEGSFTFTAMDEEDNLFIVKGDNPMCIYKFPDKGFYLYASTKDILDKACKKLHLNFMRHEQINLDEGDIICIDRHGVITKSFFNFAKSYDFFSGYDFFTGFGYRDYRTKKKSKADDSVSLLKEYASMYGITEDEIDYLIDSSYTEEEIEELISYPFLLRECIDYAYCDDY